MNFTAFSTLSVENLDLFCICKLEVRIRRTIYIRTQISHLYQDIIIQRCKEERRILENALTIASQSPGQFAYNLMSVPGYMVITAGEVVHIIKCLPVEVKVAYGEKCYEELAVSRNNKTMFLTPKSREKYK